jgi:hypothetical protein
MNSNSSNLITIIIIKLSRNPKEKYVSPSFKLSITNLDNFLSEKIIYQNISFNDLFYKTYICNLGNFQQIIRANKIPQFPPSHINMVSQNEKSFLDKYVPGKPTIIVELTSNKEKIIFEPTYLYKLKVCLISKKPNNIYEKEINYSNEILFNSKVGLITEKYINTMNRQIFSKKKIFSKSEKDNIKYVEAATKLSGLDSILEDKDIKKFTYEGRTYDDIEQFINSKCKASKLLTDERKKKIIFSTQSRIHFEDKIEYFNEQKNPFMKNEWFMGPIYSYDYNYEKYI